MRKGTKHLEETKLKISIAKVGKTFTLEHSAKISKALKGQKKTVAHRKAISLGIKAARANKVVIAVDPALPEADVTVVDVRKVNGNSVEIGGKNEGF